MNKKSKLHWQNYCPKSQSSCDKIMNKKSNWTDKILFQTVKVGLTKFSTKSQNVTDIIFVQKVKVDLTNFSTKSQNKKTNKV